MKHHIKFVHQKHLIKNHHCDICGASFTANNKLTAHLKSHAGLKEFQCGECTNVFSNKQNCREHIGKISSCQYEREKCNLCFILFQWKSIKLKSLAHHAKRWSSNWKIPWEAKAMKLLLGRKAEEKSYQEPLANDETLLLK